MTLWKSSNSPSSSSSNTSGGYPTTKSDLRPHPQPRLTRVPKLRHLTDLDIQGLNFDKQPSGSPLSAGSTPPSSPSHREFSSVRSQSAQPHPLPLPDFSLLLKIGGGCPLRPSKERSSSDGLDFPVGDGAGAIGRWGILVFFFFSLNWIELNVTRMRKRKKLYFFYLLLRYGILGNWESWKRIACLGCVSNFKLLR